MQRLNKILKKSLAKKGLLLPAESAEVCFYAEKWGKLHFVPISFSKGVLKVSVTSSCASSELQMQSENLIDFINKKMGKNIVRSIRIQLVS